MSAFRCTAYRKEQTRMERFLIFVSILSIVLVLTLSISLCIVLHTGYSEKQDICYTPECVRTASKVLNFIDPSVDPCEDFYEFSCGTFMRTTNIPDDRSIVSVESEIEDLLDEQLRMIIEQPIQSNELKAFVLAKKLYKACMNTSLIENIGLNDIKAILTKFGGWPVLEGDNWNEESFDWKQMTYNFSKEGFSSDYLFSFYIDTDSKNSTKRIICLDEAILGLNRKFLIKELEDKLVKGYYDYMVDVAVIFGADKMRAEKELLESLRFEIKLAKISLSQEKRQKPLTLYNPMTIKDLQNKFQSISWIEYINTLLHPYVAVTDDEIISVNVPKYMTEFEKLITNTSKRVQSNYLLWRMVRSSIMYLTDELRKRRFQYLALFSGKAKQSPRWEQCIVTVSDELPVAISALYIRKFFPASVRKTVENIVTNILVEFREILQNVDWMDKSTKNSALEKLATVTSHIAYPDEFLDDMKLNNYYKDLELHSRKFFKSALNITLIENKYEILDLREPVNKTSWSDHTYVTDVNAYYQSLENSIQLPAGILQGIFFNENRPSYMNYGGIGYVVGHEVTHGFDDMGRHYDKNGNLVNWWANKTEKAYTEKTKCIINQYNNYTVPEFEMHLNGLNTLCENIADIGGIKEAYLAYDKLVKKYGEEQQLPGLNYTGRQMFWISTGLSWCNKKRMEALKKQVMTDVHAPSKYRVWGAVSNSPEFARDFNCKSNTKMNPKKKCQLW